MASVVFYFEVHQPWRLKRYSVFDSHPFYFDDEKNKEIMLKVADKCYRPATRLLFDLVRKHKGNFRLSYSITGTLLDQMERWCPDVIGLFVELARSGCCEFIGETYFHSLSFLYERDEFRRQVDMHSQRIRSLFGTTPTVFRNTELIYANELGMFLSGMRDDAGEQRWHGCITEGVDRILGYRSPNYVYAPPGRPRGRAGRPFGLLLKNYRLSDDIAFRFSNRGWADWPLSAEKFARWVNQINGDGFLCNLFMDYETFGEHQWADTGIFHFLDALPGAVFDVAPGENHFNTPSEALRRFDPVGDFDAPNYISWADSERDLSAWRDNAMQHNALDEFYKLGREVHQRHRESLSAGDAERDAASHLVNDWRKLSTSDHFYYMCTKYWSDGDVHKYFSPYDSPYDAYINFMNVLDNLRTRVGAAATAP
ncbi:MAG: alpha-amylase [Phycisphaerales bacterium]|nr:alpha-amylase [Phycisphaerales bacterium]